MRRARYPPVQLNSLTYMHSRTQAPPLESASSLEIRGEHGNSKATGNKTGETLLGPKPLDSNYSSEHFLPTAIGWLACQTIWGQQSRC